MGQRPRWQVALLTGVGAATLAVWSCDALIGIDDATLGGDAAGETAIPFDGATEAASSDALAPSDASDAASDSDGSDAPACDANLGADPHNCGACGHDCQGGTCTSLGCDPVVLASGPDAAVEIHQIAVDSTSVYYTDIAGSAPAVKSVPTSGGTVTTLASLAPGMTPLGIAVAGGWVYYAVSGSSPGSIAAVPVDGGASVVLANTGTSGGAGPTAVATSGSWVYWTDTVNGTINQTPLAGGTTQVLASMQGFPGSLAADGLDVYWSIIDPGMGEIGWVGVDGGSPSYTGAATGGGDSVALDAVNVYWTNLTSTEVWQLPKGGTGPVNLAPPTTWAPLELAVDAKYVYWIAKSGSNGRIFRAPIGGGSSADVVVANTGFVPNAIALDAATIYWASSSAIYKVAKPL